MLETIKEYSPMVSKKWWGYIEIWGSIVAVFAGVVGFILWAKNTEPPMPIWSIVVIVGGAISFIIANFFTFNRLRAERDRVKEEAILRDNEKTEIIKDLKAFTINIGDKIVDACTILLKIQSELTFGKPKNDIVGIVRKKLQIENVDTDIFNATESILQKFVLNKIIQISLLTESNIRGSWINPYCSLTDFGKEIIQHLEKDKVKSD